MNQRSNELEYKILKLLSHNAYSSEEIAKDLQGDLLEIKNKIRELQEKKIIENIFSNKFSISVKHNQKLIRMALEQIYQDVTIGTKKTFDKVEAKNLIESNPRTKHNLQTIDAINIYRAGGSQSKYYRYSFYQNGKIVHHHIKGGNIFKPLVQQRVSELKNAIAHGQTHGEILSMIKSW